MICHKCHKRFQGDKYPKKGRVNIAPHLIHRKTKHQERTGYEHVMVKAYTRKITRYICRECYEKIVVDAI